MQETCIRLVARSHVREFLIKCYNIGLISETSIHAFVNQFMVHVCYYVGLLQIRLFLSKHNLVADRRLSRKRSQMSMERLKRSFTMGTIKEKENSVTNISVTVPTTVITSSEPHSPKPLSPVRLFPDTIVEERPETMRNSDRKNRYDLERERIHEQERLRDNAKHISDDIRSNGHRSVFRLSTLKGDEGLGESLDLNSEQSSGSPKVSDKFNTDSTDNMSRLQVPTDDDLLDPVDQPSCSFDFFSELFSDDPADGKPSKRVTFL